MSRESEFPALNGWMIKSFEFFEHTVITKELPFE
jgi:hypothetical protein